VSHWKAIGPRDNGERLGWFYLGTILDDDSRDITVPLPGSRLQSKR
jgi:hypothetical protein